MKQYINTSCLLLLIIFFCNQDAFSQEKKFTLLHTSDEHSTLMPIPLADYHPALANPTLGGFARLATKVREIKGQKSEPVLLFSAGDIMGGSPFSWLILNNRSSEIEIMKKIGYAGMTIGNHEFDYGPDMLAHYLKRAGFDKDQQMQIISSNVIAPEGHPLKDIKINKNKIFELSNGLKLGVFGLLGEKAAGLVPNAAPIVFNKYLEEAKKQVAELKAKGADVVIAITHSGIDEDRIMAKELKDLNIVLGGHNHIKFEEPEKVNNAFIFHTGHYLQYLGYLEFSYDADKKELRLLNKENKKDFLIPLDHTIREDPEITEMVTEYKSALNYFLASFTDSMFYDVQKPVMKSAYQLNRKVVQESTVANFVTDAMRLVTQELSGEKVDFAFQANGLLRANINPGTMEWSKNDVSFFDLATISGLGSGPDLNAGYPLVSVYLTEKEIFNVLEVSAMLSQIYGDVFFLQMSGLRFKYDPGKALYFKVPVTNFPIPANKAVISAELYSGKGLQEGDEYKLLNKDSDQLYHVVSNLHIASFLPKVGKILPHLEIVLKDKAGQQVEIKDAIIFHDNKELKVWDVVARYAMSLNEMPEYYADTNGRIIVEEGIPFYLWSRIFLGIFLLIFSFVIVKIILARNKRRTNLKAA
jgi:5'-nucleotidase / UDP-sugar diphosphatase